MSATGRPSGLADIRVETRVGRANAQRVTLLGRDLTDELIGTASYAEVLLLAVTGERPPAPHVRVLDSVLVSLVDHGMQPSALAARLTYAAAPDAVQGAMAAGLLGAGSSLLGSMEQAGRLLVDIRRRIDAGEGQEGAVAFEVDRVLDAGGKVAGFGHRLHRDGDPRAVRLIGVAAHAGVAENELSLLGTIGEHVGARLGRPLAVNATGACAAILLGIGIPWQLHRGVAMVSRAAGLLAHIGEEIEQPLTPAVRRALRESSWLHEDEEGAE